MKKKLIAISNYGTTEFWKSKKRAMDFYLNCAFACEGAEAERYLSIYGILKDGADGSEEYAGQTERNLIAGRVSIFENGTNIRDWDGTISYPIDKMGLVAPLENNLDF